MIPIEKNPTCNLQLKEAVMELTEKNWQERFLGMFASHDYLRRSI